MTTTTTPIASRNVKYLLYSLSCGVMFLFYFLFHSSTSSPPSPPSSPSRTELEIMIEKEMNQYLEWWDPIKNPLNKSFTSPTLPSFSPALFKEGKTQRKGSQILFAQKFTNYQSENLGQTPSLNWYRYALARNCTLDPRYYQQIYDDLEYWRNQRTDNFPYPITQDLLKFGQNKTGQYWVITFLTNDITMQKGQKDLHTAPFESFLRSVAPFLPHGLQIIINANAEPQVQLSGPRQSPQIFPIFSPCKESNYADICMPSFVHYYPKCYREKVKTWEEKEMKNRTLYWRGATSGATVGTNMEFHKMLRYRFIKWVFTPEIREKLVFDPDIIFTRLVQCGNLNRSYCQELTKDYSFSHEVDCLDNEDYRYLPILDGNSWVQRFIQFLRFESLLLYNPHYIEWYTNYIINPLHLYLPFRDDFSDLNLKMKWIFEHEEFVKNRVKEISGWVQKYLRLADYECYAFRLYEEYARLVEPIKGQKKWW